MQRHHLGNDAAQCFRITRSITICVISALTVHITALAQTDPRNPDAIELPVMGRMIGELKRVTQMKEGFGRVFRAVGDVDNDSLADWLVARHRVDTGFGEYNYSPVELLLYRGVRGGLPSVASGLRIGPSEIDADCSFIGAGDWDNDGYRDLAITEYILSDPMSDARPASSVVVYWGNFGGNYSNADTTHLTAPNERWSIMQSDDILTWVRTPTQFDANGDGIEDLVISTWGLRLVDRVRDVLPRLMIFLGRRGVRWNRGGHSRSPDWQYWRPSPIDRVAALDHDGDGALDIVFYRDEDVIGSQGGVSVLYGRRGALPDTSSLQSIGFTAIDGHYGQHCEFIDVTGDGVPEMIVSSEDTTRGVNWRWFVYVGIRGQRLLEQFGSGNDPPNPNDTIWWGRPWMYIWTPHHYDPYWNSPFDEVYDPGDIGLDNVGDFCAHTWPDLVFYNGGRNFDSWIDATVRTYGGFINRPVNLGDIDGSGVPAIAYSDENKDRLEMLVFVKASWGVPASGDPARLPVGTDTVMASVTGVDARRAPLLVSATPNPSSETTTLRWTPGASAATVALYDMLGRELRRWTLPRGIDAFELPLRGMPAGQYLAKLQTRHGSASTAIVIKW